MPEIVSHKTLDDAVVNRVYPYGADLTLKTSGAAAYLHLSSLTDTFINPPLTDYIHQGDTLRVVIGRYDQKHNCWNVSHKAFKRLLNLVMLGFVPGDVRLAEIVQTSELGCTLKIEQTFASLTPPLHPWSKFRVMYESGLLSSGALIEVVIGHWNAENASLIVNLPSVPEEHLSKEVQFGKVMLRRTRDIKKKNRLQNIIYAQLPNALIVRVDASAILDIEASFTIGSTVPVRIDGLDPYSNLVEATIAWELTDFSSPITLQTEDVKLGIVTMTTPYGAHCLLANRVFGFLHKSSLGVSLDRLDEYLHPGDTIEVKVIQHQVERESYKVDFVRRVERFFDDESDQSNLIDLSAMRRPSMKGGFARDSAFRWSVLAAYDHHCCICGQRFAIRDKSAMEAAHIVPRGNRGSNTLQNGLCLCPIHHWAFDSGLLTIEDDFSVRVANAILNGGKEGNWLGTLHGEQARIGEKDPVSRQALAWHRQHVFLDL